MKTTTKFKYFFLSIIVALAIGCNPEDGEDGAMGPKGEQGIQGAVGEDGQDGNANVISVFLSAIRIEIGNNTIVIPELTQEIFDTGFVIGYLTVSGSTTRWESIPLISRGEVLLDLTEINVGSLNLYSTVGQTLDFRFVLVEGTSSSGKSSEKTIRARLKNAGVSLGNYEEVMDHFGLDY